MLSMVLACSYLGISDPVVKEGLERITPTGFHRILMPEFRELSPTYRFANPEGTAAWRALERISGDAKVRQRSRTPSTLAALSRVRTPTLFIAGGADLYAPPPLLKLFSSRLPNSELAIMPDAGHSVY
jgi:non-heme chloroperoxidase